MKKFLMYKLFLGLLMWVRNCLNSRKNQGEEWNGAENAKNTGEGEKMG